MYLFQGKCNANAAYSPTICTARPRSLLKMSLLPHPNDYPPGKFYRNPSTTFRVMLLSLSPSKQPFFSWTWVSRYQNVSTLDVIRAKGEGGGCDNWNYKTCKAPVKSSPPTNQHPTFYRPDALPVARPTVSELTHINTNKCSRLHNCSEETSSDDILQRKHEPSLTVPSAVSRTLPALRSRWMTKFRCRNSRASHIGLQMQRISGSVRDLSRSSMMLSTAPPPQNSMYICQ